MMFQNHGTPPSSSLKVALDGRKVSSSQRCQIAVIATDSWRVEMKDCDYFLFIYLFIVWKLSK